MSIVEKGPGDAKYPIGSIKPMKRQMDGNPFPYEMTYEAEDGVSDNIKADKVIHDEYPHDPKVEKQIGEDGKG